MNKLKCKICDKEVQRIGSHIRIHKMKIKEYYDKYYKNDKDGKCINCGKDTLFLSFNVGYVKYCSHKCANSGCNNPMFGKQHSIETKAKISKITLERTPRGVDHPFYGKTHSEKVKEKLRNLRTMTLKDYKIKYPFLLQVEELKENKNGIYGHCKNHNCKNSKEQNGWFLLSTSQLIERRRTIYAGQDGSFFYCSDECKQNCRLFRKPAEYLIREDQINAGIIQEPRYTFEEYNTWRSEVFKRANNKCEYCGEDAKHCHHSKPQKLEPFFSLDPDYGLACCEKCHYEKGHKGECSTGQLALVTCKEKGK